MNNTYVPGFLEVLRTYLSENHSDAHRVLHQYQTMERTFLLQSDLSDGLQQVCAGEGGEGLADTPLAEVITLTQEAVFEASWVYMAVRRRIGRWLYLRIHLETMGVEEISVSEFLRIKERVSAGSQESDEWLLEVDLQPFSRYLQKPHEAHSIGRGVEFLNRRLSSRLFEELGKGDERLLEFLQVHSYRGRQLMLNDRINSVETLRRALRGARAVLAHRSPDTSWEAMAHELGSFGFEAGWGDSVSRVYETMQLLLDILEAPSPDALEAFLARIPMVFSLVILSPHGWFGQSNVLGRPDTGGR